MTEDEILIVSGLPRSGTSLMMQILSFSERPLLCDTKRKPDIFNRSGYFEYSPVKRLASESRWLEKAQGKIIKIVAPLILNLPPRFNYRVIYMDRDPQKIACSQQKMMRNDPEAIITPTQDEINLLRRITRHNLAWLQSKPHIQLSIISFEDIINHPEKTITQLSFFINETINLSSACTIIHRP